MKMWPTEVKRAQVSVQLRLVDSRRASTHGREILWLQVPGNRSKLRPTCLLSVWPLA